MHSLISNLDKRIWLRPGKSFLFGRTKESADYVINDKSVSRKHLLISVAPVKHGDGVHVHTRSELTIRDDSKHGTVMEGERLLKESRTIVKNHNKIKLGNYGPTFTISWKPVVLCLAFPDKQNKSKGSDILAPYRARLESLDIKVMLEFIFGQTTHVIANKRNTAKGLQALIAGSYIVTDAFVTRIESAAKISQDSPLAKTSMLSPLEEDFDKNWPRELMCLPHPGKEPAPRPAELFAPDSRRMRVFEDYTFVISDTVQYETLQPVVLSGGAKCVKFNLTVGSTPLNEFVDFVKTIGGETGIGIPRDEHAKPGIIVVRFRRKQTDKTFNWALQFIAMVDDALGQRSIEQNEFLDAILTNDATKLRQPLQGQISQGHNSKYGAGDEESFLSTDPDPSLPMSNTSHRKVSSPLTKRNRHVITSSRFRGFDDFDPGQLKTVQRSSPIPDAGAEPEMNDAPQSLFVGASQISQAMSPDSHNLQKRRRPSPSHKESSQSKAEIMFESLLPAATALKKRRLQETEDALRITNLPVNETANQKPSKMVGTVKKIVNPQVDIRSIARKRREQLDLDAFRESEALNTIPNDEKDEDISELRNLAIIEEMVVPLLADKDYSGTLTQMPTKIAAAEKTGIRWNEQWNGRRNFKKFQPQEKSEGVVVTPSTSSGSVFVTFEEVKRKDYGIGESYWLSEPTVSSSRSYRDRTGEKSVEGPPDPQSKLQHKARRVLEIEIGEFVSEEEASEINSPRRIENLQGNTRKRRQPVNSKNGKRSAPSRTPTASPPPAKKLKKARIQSPEELDEQGESDGDGMRFRFTRSRRKL